MIADDNFAQRHLPTSTNNRLYLAFRFHMSFHVTLEEENLNSWKLWNRHDTDGKTENANLFKENKQHFA